MTRLAVVLATIAAGTAGMSSARADAPPPAAPDDKPDPAAQRAGEANLESLDKRRGFTFGAAFGASLTFGTDVGTGGALSVRLGQVATPTTVVAFEGNLNTLFHNVPNADDPMAKHLVANVSGTFLAGMQHWIGPSLYVRLGAGGGVYRCNECGKPDAMGVRATRRYAGLAGGAGVGIDIVRWGGVVLGIEAHAITLFSLDGLLSNDSLGLTLSFD